MKSFKLLVNRGILITLCVASFSFSFANELAYKGKPLLVNVSNQVSNIIEFPENIRKVISSSHSLTAKIQGNKVIVLLPSKSPADLLAFTDSGKVYALLLNPEVIPTQIVDIVDKENEKKKKAEQIEKGRNYEDKIVHVLKAAVNGRLGDYYRVKAKVQTLETQHYFIQISREYHGGEFGVLLGKVYTKGRYISPISEEELATVLSQIWNVAGLTIFGDRFYAAITDYHKEIHSTYQDQLIKKYLRR